MEEKILKMLKLFYKTDEIVGQSEKIKNLVNDFYSKNIFSVISFDNTNDSYEVNKEIIKCLYSSFQLIIFPNKHLI